MTQHLKTLHKHSVKDEEIIREKADRYLTKMRSLVELARKGDSLALHELEKRFHCRYISRTLA